MRDDGARGAGEWESFEQSYAILISLLHPIAIRSIRNLRSRHQRNEIRPTYSCPQMRRQTYSRTLSYIKDAMRLDTPDIAIVMRNRYDDIVFERDFRALSAIDSLFRRYVRIYILFC